MTNIDNFKLFVKKNPNLIKFIRNGTMSWQRFYELYDLYGEENNVWNEYLSDDINRNVKETNNQNQSINSFPNIIQMAKKIDANKIQDGITSIQKAIALFGDIISKESTETKSTYQPRPIYRRFDD